MNNSNNKLKELSRTSFDCFSRLIKNLSDKIYPPTKEDNSESKGWVEHLCIMWKKFMESLTSPLWPGNWHFCEQQFVRYCTSLKRVYALFCGLIATVDSYPIYFNRCSSLYILITQLQSMAWEVRYQHLGTYTATKFFYWKCLQGRGPLMWCWKIIRNGLGVLGFHC